jgi:hypothetical protein
MRLLQSFQIVKNFDLSAQADWLLHEFPADFCFIDYFIDSPRFNEKSTSQDIMSTSYIDGVFGLLPPQVKSRYEQEMLQPAPSQTPSQTTESLFRPKIDNLFFDAKYSLKALESSGRLTRDRAEVGSAHARS